MRDGRNKGNTHEGGTLLGGGDGDGDGEGAGAGAGALLFAGGGEGAGAGTGAGALLFAGGGEGGEGEGEGLGEPWPFRPLSRGVGLLCGGLLSLPGVVVGEGWLGVETGVELELELLPGVVELELLLGGLTLPPFPFLSKMPF